MLQVIGFGKSTVEASRSRADVRPTIQARDPWADPIAVVLGNVVPWMKRAVGWERDETNGQPVCVRSSEQYRGLRSERIDDASADSWKRFFFPVISRCDGAGGGRQEILDEIGIRLSSRFPYAYDRPFLVAWSGHHFDR